MMMLGGRSSVSSDSREQSIQVSRSGWRPVLNFNRLRERSFFPVENGR